MDVVCLCSGGFFKSTTIPPPCFSVCLREKAKAVIPEHIPICSICFPGWQETHGGRSEAWLSAQPPLALHHDMNYMWMSKNTYLMSGKVGVDRITSPAENSWEASVLNICLGTSLLPTDYNFTICLVITSHWHCPEVRSWVHSKQTANWTNQSFPHFVFLIRTAFPPGRAFSLQPHLSSVMCPVFIRQRVVWDRATMNSLQGMQTNY